MTKALIPKQGGNLANRTLKAGWPAPAGRAVAAYGRAVAQQAAAGRGVNKFWGDVTPVNTLAAYAQNDWGRSIPERPRNSSCIDRRATMTIPAIHLRLADCSGAGAVARPTDHNWTAFHNEAHPGRM
jgi:hypothetical protein